MRVGTEKYSIVFLIAIASIVAFSYQGAEASYAGGLFEIADEENGRHCEDQDFGTWYPDTKTCELNTGLEGNIVILSDGITIDGRGHSIHATSCDLATGILAEGLKNITIKDLTIYEFDTGILFVNVDDSTVLDVHSNRNCSHGIELREGSDNNTIENGDFNRNGDDNILLRESNFNTFDRIGADGSGGDNGIDLESSHNNQFNDASVYYNESTGIDIGTCRNDEVCVNYETNSGSNNNKFTNSRIVDNDGDGIKLTESNGNSFTNIESTKNDDNGMFFGNSHNNVVTKSKINENENEGVELQESDGNVFTLNSMSYNWDSGVDIEDGSDNNTFSCNYVTNNGQEEPDGAGFEIEENSNGNKIFKNQVEGNDIGIGLYDGAEDNEITRNNIVENDIQLDRDGEGDNILSPNYWNPPPDGFESADFPFSTIGCTQSACEMFAGMERFGNEDPRNGSLAHVDVFTGELTEIGPATLDIAEEILDEWSEADFGLSGIAFHPDGRLFGSLVVDTHDDPGTISFLVEIDPETGNLIFESLEDIHPITTGYEPIEIVDLAFLGEELYGIGTIDYDDEYGLLQIPLEPEEDEFEIIPELVGFLVLDDEYDPDDQIAGGLSFLTVGEDTVMLVTGEVDDYETMYVLSIYEIPLEIDDDYIIPDETLYLEQFYDGLGVSCEGEIYATTEYDDSVWLITLHDDEGLYAEEQFAAGAGTNPGDVDFRLIEEDEEIIEVKTGGTDTRWDTRPTYGVNHENLKDQIVENGFQFNDKSFTITDNHHTDFAKQQIKVGETNSFAATVYAPKGLWIQEFLFGVPAVGEGHLAEVGVEVWYSNNGEIDEVKVVQKTNVIDPETVKVTHQKSLCKDSDPEPKCDTTKVSMMFREPLKDDVTIIKGTDFLRRSQSTSLNDGFNVFGTSLNPMLTELISSSIKGEGLVLVTQHEKYSDYWIAQDGRIYEKNSFGTFIQINKEFERFQDKGDPRTRLHSGFGGILVQEQDRATVIFDSSGLVAELPPSFAYEFPETTQRIDEKLRQEMIIQEHIAQKLLENVSKQARFH